MKKNLILGTSWGYSTEKISPFVLSWKKYCSDSSNLYLVVNPNIHKDTAEFLKDNGVVLKSFYAAHFIPDTLNLTRYYKYFDILSEERGQHNGVLLTDIRDVIFQGNPFNRETENGLHFFYEDESILIGHQAFASTCMDYNYGQKVTAELSEERVICSGTTIGDQISVMRYLYALANQRNLGKMMKVIPMTGSYMFDNPPIDQAMHQYIHYKKLVNSTVHENGDIVSTLALTPSEKISINDDGFIQLGENISPIIHQWDRHINLVNHIAEMYQVPFDEITLPAGQEREHFTLMRTDV